MSHRQARGQRKKDRTSEVISQPITQFLEFVRSAYPKSLINVDAPENPKGVFWLDIRDGKFETHISWQKGIGFGFFADIESEGYGDKPTEIYRDANMANGRFSQMKANWVETSRIEPMELKNVRELVGTKQVQMAQLLKISQAAVSKVEKRGDVKLSSLSSYIKAMGGRLELRVHFDSFQAPIKRTTAA